MSAPPPPAIPETAESVANGERNKKFLEAKQAENKMLPDYVRHKTLTEIWQKETPCECPFHLWRPVCGVDGNTYPTECFAVCIDMPIFVHADCKFVQKELWARMKDKEGEGKVEIDDNEMCAEGDDDGDDPRPKCTRQLAPEEAVKLQQPVPFPEDSEWILPPTPKQPPPSLVSLTSTHAHTLRGEPSNTHNNNNNNDDNNSMLRDEDGGTIEMREYNGMKVPFYTGPVTNPCPHCAMVYRPVCARDEKTYPSACFASCVGVEIKSQGECEEVK